MVVKLDPPSYLPTWASRSTAIWASPPAKGARFLTSAANALRRLAGIENSPWTRFRVQRCGGSWNLTQAM